LQPLGTQGRHHRGRRLLTVFAVLVFFTNLLSVTLASFAAGTLALYAAVAAFVILLLGVFIEGV
jgi:hypothetical protein